MNWTRAAAFIVTLAGVSPLANAHEFWIEPASHRLPAPGAISADLKVGQNLKGGIFPYLSERFVSYRIDGPAGRHDVIGNEGDIPSLTYEASLPGLYVLTYHSTADRLDYDEWATFVDYADYEGLEGAVETHLAAGLPKTGFAELYIRCAKALVQVGAPATGDEDLAIGMPLELIALANPFMPDLGQLPVRLLWQGEAAANIQISIFREMGRLERTTLRTDEDGRVIIPLEDGGRFLLNAVHIARASADDGVVWKSHWASLTFDIGS